MSFFTEFQISLIACVVSFAAGVFLSTKILDFIKGVPADARAVLKSAEGDVVAKLATAKSAVLTDLQAKIGVTPAPAPKVAVAPAAQATLTPAPAPAPAPASQA